jgi:hypothetical protein
MHIVNCGSLVVNVKSWYEGDTITVYRLNEQGQQGEAFYASVSEHVNGAGKAAYAAFFPTLLPGNYKVIEPGYTAIGKSVTVFPGNVAQVNYT